MLAELAETIDPDKLVSAANTAPVPWAQRLGFLLERAEAHTRAGPLQNYVRARAHESALLLPKAPLAKARRNDRWKLYINSAVEVDL